jgi:peptidoglycan/LPS O-acetylase OafA/YrhL
VFCVLVVVATHLLFVGVGTDDTGGLSVSSPAEAQAWFDAATWVGQIMPLFFVVAGFAALTSYRRAAARGGTPAGYVANRLLRLTQPALPLFVFSLLAIATAHLLSLDSILLTAIVAGAGSPLWFLAAFTLCQALVPFAVRWHTQSPVRTLLWLLAGVLAVDTLQFALQAPAIGYLNFFFVWVLVQQIGFWYADGWFARRTWWQLCLIAAGGWASLVPLTVWGPYDTDMLFNLNPPTLPLVVLGIGQAALLRLLHPVLSRFMSLRPAQAVVAFFGTRLMTIYLWHLPVIIVLAIVALVIPGASPEPETPAWWWSRLLAYLLVLAAVFLISLLVGRWEQPRPLERIPSPQVVATAAVLALLPPLAVTMLGLDVWIALAGVVLYSAAILLVRWPQPGYAPQPSPHEQEPTLPSTSPAATAAPSATPAPEPDGA